MLFKGWYRDCGIIPHTIDVDIYAFAHEYEAKLIKDPFMGNKYVRIWGIYGFPNDSYEFRLIGPGFSYDILFVYRVNETHDMGTVHGYGRKI